MRDMPVGRDDGIGPTDQVRRRLYSDAEVGDLIRIASKRQDEEKTALERGISLLEVERIASEIGVDPVQVRAAARELEQLRNVRTIDRIFGGPFEMGHKRFVDGVATIRQWEEIVPEVRRALGGTGRIDQLGTTWEWTRQVKDMNLVLSETQIRVRAGEGQTMIEARTHYRGGAAIGYLLGAVLSATTAAVFLDGAGQSDLVNTAVLAASSAGGLAAARASIAAWSARQRLKLKQVMDWLDDTISRAEPTDAAVPEKSVAPSE